MEKQHLDISRILKRMWFYIKCGLAVVIGMPFVIGVLIAIFDEPPTADEIAATEAKIVAEEQATMAKAKVARLAREAATRTLVDEFNANKTIILSDASKLLQTDPEQVLVELEKYRFINDQDLNLLWRDAAKIIFAVEEKQILSRIEEIGGIGGYQSLRLRDERINHIDKYKRLTEIQPDNNEYKNAYAAVLKEKAMVQMQKRIVKKVESHFSVWDGSHRILERLIISSLNDPDSYEHIETNILFTYEDHIVVKTRYRARNRFGGMIVGTVIAKASVEDGSIIKVIHQE